MKMNFSEDSKALKPLKNRLFYLDLKFSKKQDVVALSQDLIDLGGHIERFLSKEIKYVVTDRPNWKPADSKSLENWAPDTPNSTPSPYTLNKCEFGDDSPFTETDLKRNRPQTSRGRQLLEQSTKYHKRDGSADVLENSRQWGIRILSIATVLKWVEKTKKGIQKAVQKKVLHQSKKSNSLHVMGVKKLISPFIKVEDKHRRHRTFFKEFSEWPDISGTCSTQISHELNKVQEKGPNIYANGHQLYGAAEGFAAKAQDMFKKRSLKQEAETKRKSYCEICCAPYSSLQQHLLTKGHRGFLSDKTNYLHLNEVILTLPLVDKFLAEHQVSTSSNLTVSRMNKMEANRCQSVRSEARRVKARRRVATNLVHKFELCTIPTSNDDGKENAHTRSLEEERIDASCNSPLYSGFPFLEGNDALETTFEKPSIFPGTRITQSGIGRADASISLPLEEESDVTKGDTSIIFDSIHNNSHEHEVLEVPVPETRSLNAINILSPPDSVLYTYDDSMVDNNCENAHDLENCVQLECTVAGTRGPAVVDDQMTEQSNISIDVSRQASATCMSVPQKSVVDMSTQDISIEQPLQTVGCDFQIIPENSAATCTSVPVVNAIHDTFISTNHTGTLQTVGCDFEMVQEISAEDMVSLGLHVPVLEKVMSSNQNVMDVDLPSVHLENQIESNNAATPNSSLILPIAGDCKIVPEIVLPVNVNESEYVSPSILPLCQNDDHYCNSENTGQDECESNIGESLKECFVKVVDIFADIEQVDGKKENDFALGFNDCVACLRENAEFLPLNLCVRQGNAIVNDEPVANKSTPQMYSLNPEKKRGRGSGSQSRKVRILSDRSMLTIFDSDDDELEFSGFKSDDKIKSLGLSYEEVSEFSEELENDEMTFQIELNSECSSSEVEDEWDISLAEFIERQVSDKPQSSCTKLKVESVDILPMDLSSNSADT